MIYSLANVGKCFFRTPVMAGRFLWVCQGLSVLRSVFPSILLSIFTPSFCLPFCLFRSVSFAGIYTLVFCDIWHGIRAACGIVCGIFTEKSGWAKMTKKWSEMTQKWDFSTIFKNFVINFCKKHQSSYTNTIFGKILFLELQLVKAKALNQSD